MVNGTIRLHTHTYTIYKSIYKLLDFHLYDVLRMGIFLRKLSESPILINTSII